jgi:phosphonate transport system substrate-binding protein
MVGKGQLRAGQLSRVWESELTPANPVTVGDDLDPALRTKIADVFRDKANVDYLNANGFCGASRCTGAEDTGDWGYTPADDAFYTSVRTVCATTKAKQCTAS